MGLIFCDCETTGLEPDRHDVWEIALIDEEDTELVWTVFPDLSVADPNALRICRFYERTGGIEWADHAEVAWEVARITAGHHLVGAVPSFDAAFLGRFLRQWGHSPAWHYHLVDVEALIAGFLQWEPPWNSNELSAQIGVDPEEYDRHTALGDARWAKAIYEAVMRGGGDASEPET